MTEQKKEKTQYLTKSKKLELEQELEHLKKFKRKEVAEDLQHARSLGDISENAEYHEARDEQAKVEERIKYLEDILKNAEIFSNKTKRIEVFLGSTVTLEKKKTEEKKKYHIVGTEESDVEKNKISYLSPLGKAMMGKKKGDTFSFVAPNEVTKEYKVISIE